MPHLLVFAACGLGVVLLWAAWRWRGRGAPGSRPASANAATVLALRGMVAAAGLVLLAIGAWQAATDRGASPGATDVPAAAAADASAGAASVPASAASGNAVARASPYSPATAFAPATGPLDAATASGPATAFAADSTGSETTAESSQLSGLPAGQLSDDDSVQIVDVTPAPGITLKRGVPLTFRLKMAYTLQSADTAVMSVGIAQVRDSAVACNVATPALVDAAEVPIERGRHLIDVSITWSGDSGAATDGRVFGKGYLSFVPAFWQRSGNGRRHQFSGYESVCLRFEP